MELKIFKIRGHKMARPKKNSDNKQALERIEEAFWFLLETKPYSKITLNALSEQSNVNRNTIYYYFENIDDMAHKFFIKNMPVEIAKILLSSIINDTLDIQNLPVSDDLLQKFTKARLYLNSDSVFLVNIFKKSVFDLWLLILKIDMDKLTLDEKIDIEFIFNGLIAVLGSPLINNNPLNASSLLDRDLGKGISTSLRKIYLANR